MRDRITYCDIVECCKDCPKYGDDCDGDKRNDELISRADAIGAVAHEYGAKHIRSVGETVADILQALKALPSAEPSLKAIKRQIGEHWYLDPPSAEAVQGWIPCSERLPSENGWYVISVVGLKNITDVSYFYSDESKWSDVSHTQSVVAWMPLPTPYKGGKEE